MNTFSLTALAFALMFGSTIYAGHSLKDLEFMEKALSKKYDKILSDFNEKQDMKHYDRLANIEKRLSEIWKEKIEILEKEAASKDQAKAEKAEKAKAEVESVKTEKERELEEARAKLKHVETKVSKEPVYSELPDTTGFQLDAKHNFRVSYNRIKGQAMSPVKNRLVSGVEAKKLLDMAQYDKRDGEGYMIRDLKMTPEGK